jgi:CheY-like chemotaxis protein
MELPYPRQLELSFGEPIRLLVVEDDADTLEMLQAYFSGQGYQVETAQTGQEALALLTGPPDFDLILLDLFLPDIGGLELLAQINHLPAPPGVILLTGLADREIARDALRQGAFDCILKPYSLPQVESSVVACLAHRDYLKQGWWKRIVLRPAS